MRHVGVIIILALGGLAACGGGSDAPPPAVPAAPVSAAPAPHLATTPPTQAQLVRLLDGPAVAGLTDSQIDGLGAQNCKQLRDGLDHGSMALGLSYVLGIPTSDAASLMGYLAGAYCPGAVPAATAT